MVLDSSTIAKTQSLRRRHADPPAMWLWVALGSGLFHGLVLLLLLPWVLRVSVTQAQSSATESAIAPIQMVDLGPSEATPPDQPAVSAPAEAEIAAGPEPAPDTAAPAEPALPEATPAIAIPEVDPTVIPPQPSEELAARPTPIPTPSDRPVRRSIPIPRPTPVPSPPAPEETRWPSPRPTMATPFPPGQRPIPRPQASPTDELPAEPAAEPAPTEPEAAVPSPPVPSPPAPAESEPPPTAEPVSPPVESTPVPEPEPVAEEPLPGPPSLPEPPGDLAVNPYPDESPDPLDSVEVAQEVTPSRIIASLQVQAYENRVYSDAAEEAIARDAAVEPAAPVNTTIDYVVDPSQQVCSVGDPSIWRNMGESVSLLVVVWETGEPEVYNVLEGTTNPAYDQLAQCLVENWEFRPAQGEGSAVASENVVRITINQGE